MDTLVIAIGAALLAWLGARWSLTLHAYEQQRRAIPGRTLVTVLAAAVTATWAASQGATFVSGVFLALWSVVFVLVAVIDIETHFIPNVLILPATVVALLLSFVDPRLSPLSAGLGALAGFVLFYLIALVARGGFGMGDVKLAAFMGAVAGLIPMLYALLLGILLGGLGAVLLLLSRRVTRRTFIPYGPYLCLGGWLGMLPTVQQLWGL